MEIEYTLPAECVDFVFRSRQLADWQGFSASNPDVKSRVYSAQVLTAIRKNGFRDPVLRTWYSPRKIHVRSENLRETITAGGLMSRQRAILVELRMLSELHKRLDSTTCSVYAPGAERGLATQIRARYKSSFLSACGELVLSNAVDNFKTPESLAALPFPPEALDLVILGDMFHSGQSIDEILAETGRVLKKDGVMLATFPFNYNKESGAPGPRHIANARSGHNGVVERDLAPGALARTLVRAETPGWDIVGRALDAGFEDSYIAFVSSEYHAVLGGDINGVFVFVAGKGRLRARVGLEIIKSPKGEDASGRCAAGGAHQPPQKSKPASPASVIRDASESSDALPPCFFDMLDPHSYSVAEDRVNLADFFDVGNHHYCLIANNPDMAGNLESVISRDKEPWIIQFNKCIHDASLHGARKAYFYNGRADGGLWGFDGFTLKDDLDRNGLHFCFNVNSFQYLKWNPGLTLLSMVCRPLTCSIVNYPADKIPSIGFSALLVLMYIFMRKGIPFRDRISLVGFTGSTVLTQHHATAWEQDFIRACSLSNTR